MGCFFLFSSLCVLPSDLKAFGLNMVLPGRVFGVGGDSVDATLWASHGWYRHRGVDGTGKFRTFLDISAWVRGSSWVAVRRSKVGSDQMVPGSFRFSYQPCSGHCWLRRISKDCGGQVPGGWVGWVAGWAGWAGWAVVRQYVLVERHKKSSWLVIAIIPRISHDCQDCFGEWHLQLVVSQQLFALHHLGFVHCRDVCELCVVLSEKAIMMPLCHICISVCIIK